MGKTSVPLNLQKIEQKVENLEYDGVADFIADMQLMLKSVVEICSFSREVCFSYSDVLRPEI